MKNFVRAVTFVALIAAAGIAAAGLPAAPVSAADDTVQIVLRDHKFVPDQIEIPANKAIKLVVKNEDKTPEEFESHDLKREKVVAPGREITIPIGPLKPGTYKFYGEYNPKTAQGVIIVK